MFISNCVDKWVDIIRLLTKLNEMTHVRSLNHLGMERVGLSCIRVTNPLKQQTKNEEVKPVIDYSNGISKQEAKTGESAQSSCSVFLLLMMHQLKVTSGGSAQTWGLVSPLKEP